jgi:RimJ/RimL family protein N-acetyltransferase
MDAPVEVRPFAAPHEYAAMIDYFLGGTEAFQRGMGIDPARLPRRDEWLRAALADHERPDGEKERFYVAWRRAGELVGHSSISHIALGETAHCHLHLWRPELRGAGLGPACLERSIELYFERFRLESLACEPFADNPGPNRVLPRLGFRWVRRYRTVPTGFAFEQDVNRYELSREAWEARRLARCGAPG